MTDILDELKAVDAEYVTIDKSGLDPKVWVPHIPYSDIASSEGMASTSIRRVKAYVQGSRFAWDMLEPSWFRANDSMWIFYDAFDIPEKVVAEHDNVV